MSQDTNLTVIVPVGPRSEDASAIAHMIKNCSSFPIKIIFVVENVNSEVRELLTKTQSEIDNFDIINGEFGSPGRARNVGLDNAFSRWVAFWDSDDLPHPDKLAEFLSMDLKESFGAAVFSFDELQGELLEINSSQILKSHKGNFVAQVSANPGLWRFIFSRARIGELRFDPDYIGEDVDFLIRMNLKMQEVRIFEQVIYTYNNSGHAQLSKSESNLKSLYDRLSSYRRFQLLSFSELSSAFYLRLLISGLFSRNSRTRRIALHQMWRIAPFLFTRYPITIIFAVKGILINRLSRSTVKNENRRKQVD